MIELKLKKNELGNNIFVGIGEDTDFVCSQCLKQIREGFICENRKELVLCIDCQEVFQMSKCKHDKEQTHKHIKFTRSKEDDKL